MATTTAPSQPTNPPDPTIHLAARLLSHTSPRYTFSFTPFLQRTYRHTLASDRPGGDDTNTTTANNGTTTTTTTTTNDQPNPNQGSGGSSGFGSLVCKHWLRGLCKKGETCEFLHEYNLRKMPECNFFVRNGYCSNGDECLYLHVDPSSRLPPCPHYERGFCPLGPRCDKRHVRRRMCPYYLAGFCPDGRMCREGAHPRWVADKDLEKPRARDEVDGEKVEEGGQQAQQQHRERELELRGRDRDRDGERDRDRGHEGGRHKDRGGWGKGGRWRGKGGRFRGRH
ncbi:hypothetical protein VTJ49DRAFT_40 [Mycothermus thermophilus]|uniref:mRNA 3'-end-processing protein n=1 Tax=Humicola insolens TaxID=85995 RepID=A0ABR3VRT4_HUMIN